MPNSFRQMEASLRRIDLRLSELATAIARLKERIDTTQGATGAKFWQPEELTAYLLASGERLGAVATDQKFLNDVIAMRGMYVGADADPTDNDVYVTGDIRAGEGLSVGDLAENPDDNDVHIAGSINESISLSCRAYRSSVQSIPNNTWTTIYWNAEDWDNDSMHDNVTNNNRIVAWKAGVYIVGSTISFAPNAVGSRVVDLMHAGTPFSRVRKSSVSGAETCITVVGLANATAGQNFQVRVLQDSGGALDIGDETFEKFWAARLA